MLFEAIKKEEKIDEKEEKISKLGVKNFYKNRLEGKCAKKRTFEVISSSKDKKYIKPDDFKPLFRYLLDTHPGLEFLQQTPEFQDRYADTVVMRIFFTLDSNDDGLISWRDFKQSNLMDTFLQLSTEKDINVVR